jgi:protein-disulfide isomerase
LLVAAGVAWFVMDPGFRTQGTSTDTSSAMPPDEFERRVRAYILENPEVLVKAMQRLQARQRAAEANEAAAVLRARADEVFRDPASPVGGNPEGDVTLVEFFDYNCPYCRQVAPVMNDVEAADPQLRIVYKEFPILGANSVYAAKAALAAHRQGRYAAFHKALMQADGAAKPESVLAVATEVGLDVARLKADMEDPAIQDAISRNLALARELRITGTPGFVVGERILRGATDLKTLQGLIGEARRKP